MEGLGEVRFELFGDFRTQVNGRLVAFPDRDFFTYLKLLLLSGELFLNNSGQCPLAGENKHIRDIVDKGNKPRRFPQGGHYDFTRLSGLELRFREGLGLCLNGAEWTSDIREFEALWFERGEIGEEDLKRALTLSTHPVSITTWKHDRILVDCSDWVQKRLQTLADHRREIETELILRQQGKDNKQEGVASGDSNAPPVRLSDEKESHQETSSFDEGQFEPGTPDEPSTDLREALCRLGGADEGTSQAKAGGESEDDNHQQEIVREEPVKDSQDEQPSSGKPPASSEWDELTELMNLELVHPKPETKGRRTATRLGVAVAAVLALTFFGFGFWVSRMGQTPSGNVKENQAPRESSQAPPEQAESLDEAPQTDQPEQPTGADQPQSTDSPNEDSETLHARAPGGSVSLKELFVEGIEHDWPSWVSNDVTIGGQLFAGYYEHPTHLVFAPTSREECSGVFKLDRNFKEFTCIVGVPDIERDSFIPKAAAVYFDGDGVRLATVKARTNLPQRVKLNVTGIKALCLTYARPVVIVEPEVSN